MDWILFRKRYLLNNTKDHFIICLSSYIFAKTKQLFMKTNLLAFLLLLTISCKQNNKEIASSNELTNTAYTPEVFGDSIDVSGALSVNDVLASLKTNDSIMCAVNGYVTGVCHAKGCWMMLSQSPSDSTGLFVKFADYGFFVPKDLSSSRVIVRGKAFKQVTSVDELKHYAEDEGKSSAEIEAITQPEEEMKFMADGVVVIERKK